MDHTKAKAARLDVVEDVLREQGWSPSWERKLAARWGLTRRTVRTYKLEVLRRVGEELRNTGADAHRSDIFITLERCEREAAKQGRWGRVAMIARMRAQILGVDDPPSVPEPDALEETDRGELLRLIAEDMSEEELMEALRIRRGTSNG